MKIYLVVQYLSVSRILVREGRVQGKHVKELYGDFSRPRNDG
jgi:hypothetical protein